MQPTAPALAPFDAFTGVRAGRAVIDPAVGGYVGAFGGYVLTLALRAMAEAVGDPERAPRSLALHLLAPVAPGELVLDARAERAGGAMTRTSARIGQDGETVALAIGAFGAPRPALAHREAVMPDVPGPEACAPLVERPVDAGVNVLVEHRPARGPLPLSGGDRAELVAWMRLGEERSVDAASASFLADALAPGLYGALDSYVPMPSADITVHYAEPASDGPWVLAHARNRIAGEGYAIEDLELWAPDGHLLLVSRQLRRIQSAP